MTTLDLAHTGDTGDYRDVTLAGIDDLTDATTIYARVWRPGDMPATLAVTVLDAVARTVRVHLGTAAGWLPTLRQPRGHTARYDVRITAAFSDGSQFTWPADTLPVEGRT